MPDALRRLPGDQPLQALLPYELLGKVVFVCLPATPATTACMSCAHGGGLKLWYSAEPMRALVLRRMKAAFHFTCSHLVALTLAAAALMNLVRTRMHSRQQQRSGFLLLEARFLSIYSPCH